LFLWVNHISYPLGETFWSCTTLLGDGLVVFALLGMMLRYRPQVAWAGLLASPWAAVWTHGLRHLLGPLPRPASVLPLESFT